jgi:hypothetical protein
MKKYSVVAVLWEDHSTFDRVLIPENPDTVITPTLSIGVIIKETEKVIVLVHDIERYAHDGSYEASYMIIYKACIVSIKKYGKIEIEY